jgi:hypothetical protein
MPSQCPVCGDPLRVARLECDGCSTAIEGDFDNGRLGRLTREQIAFVEVFLECRGKIKDVEERLGLSYPTVVARLENVVDALGAPVRTETRGGSVDSILSALARKDISAEDAAKKLKARRK